jgi:hypothetical protein
MRFLILFISLFVLLTSPVSAQEIDSQINTSGSIYKNDKVDAIKRMQRDSMATKGFIKPQSLEVSLVRYKYMEDDQFGILMVVPDVVSGCWDLSPLEYESTFIDPYYFDVKVKDYQRTPIEVANINGDCPAGNKMSSALIVLSKSDLEKRQIRQIRFSNGFVADYYDISYTDKTFQLKPQSMAVFRAKGMTGPLADHLEIQFGAGGKIALHVPMAKQGENLSEQVENLARMHALTPDPEMPMSYGTGGSQVFYYNDDNGHIAGSIGEDGYTELGVINVPRPYDGPNGRTLTAVPLQVYVTRPGTQL